MRNPKKQTRSRASLKTVPLLPRIKICGLTRPDEARAAVLAGADAIGFVHHAPSPRSLSMTQAQRIVETVEERALTVAVLVDAVPEEALQFLEQSGARAVQLCGDERAPDWVGFPHPILRRVPVHAAAEQELEGWLSVASLFVLDHPTGPGGTGRTVDVDLARHLATRAPCLLAGGLSEQNVEERVAAVKPFGVDASTRLELSAGRKDTVRVHAFAIRALEALGPAPKPSA